MGSSASDLKRQKALAWSAFWKLEHLWRSSVIPISTKVKLFQTICVTVLLNGCETWVITHDMEDKINAFATSCYRIMLNIRRLDRIPNTTIYNLTNTVSLVVRLRTRQLKFLGHVLRMPDDEPARFMHCTLHCMVKESLADSEHYIQDISRAFLETMRVTCNWTTATGGNLWSPAPQPNE
ncbi:uncharacterized protein LOC119728045 [Patiria miniata]|uniref:Uncharacterized protein n=1 Tax=Patiria miniata TaxID=46514 RepID=A0A913ZYB0_PATMI|nr:uncharacterized protein LOC119728045 [Patiria miniata]